MSEARHLAQASEDLFVNPAHGIFTPFAVAIQGLTGPQAAQTPAPRFNSMWAVVEHVRFWEEWTLRLLQGNPMSRDEVRAANGGWFPIADPNDEAAWQAAAGRAIAVNKDLAAVTATLNDEQLNREVFPGLPVHRLIQNIIAHDSYHTCEVITIRHMLGLWLERT